MHKQQKTHLPVLFAGVLSIATVSHAAVCTLPVPPPCGYVDTERSTNIPITVWRDYCRRVVVRFAANATPTNAIQVAFGRDRDNNADLAPEETELILGVDCGERFVRSYGTCAPTGSEISLFELSQPKEIADRWDMAKVTVRGKGTTAAEIAAELFTKATVLWIR